VTKFLTEDIEEVIKNTENFSKLFSGKRILITGGNGFLGKYFVEIFKTFNTFLKKPIKLYVFDTSIKKNVKKNQNFTFLNKDVSNNFSFNTKVDIVIHAAGIASPFYYRKRPIETLDVAINGTRNCLDIAKKNKARFIFFSSSEIYGDPDNFNVPTKETYKGNVSSLGPRACYDESKRLGETLCYVYNNYFNLHTNIIRPFNIYGPGMNQKDYRIFPNFISNIINNKKLFIYGSGKQTRTYCYITDALEGFLRVICFGKSGEAYNIGNNKPEVSVKDVTEILKKIHIKKLKTKLINHPKSYPNDEPQRRCPDLQKAKRDLQYKPKVKLQDGLEKFLNWAKLYYKKY
tara:strand:- start:2212 stop:3249 length:1038 start_codon:yes stop_codon:yes gene_type:complete